ncbi:ABC transporter substrate-binding protein [Streptomyces brasiliensis]|uniref:Branched chain amino acid ABC transporter substrate-binding protein n=1 Tax=Streptomyces brasiliensis TaxID=1954 RepID=A0A917KZN6_9ACTN|nr:ABC transporter substrate-binding protein [Streptomyces brasiliensis]GGJ35581.1 branched chain amino acid ABC transporter substrate-binding protein [Streptomyces brasiliensis]
MTRTHKAALALVALLPVLGACSSAGAANSEGSDGAIKLMNITAVNSPLQNYPDVKAGAEAAVKSINAKGGLNGKKIELTFCNTNSDPNQALACARKAVSQKVAAVVGYTDTFSSQALPVFEKAKIPAIGLMPRGNAIELNSAAAYPFEGGSAGSSVAAAAGLKGEGAKVVVSVAADVPSAVANADLVKKGAEAAGLKFGGSVKIPTSGVSDFAPYARQIKAMGGDGVMFNATVGQIQGVMKATQAVGMKVHYAQHATAFGVNEAKKTGAPAEGLLLVSAYQAYSDTSSEGIKAFNADMDAAGSSDPGLKRPTAINAWLSVYAVKVLAEGQGGAPAIKGDISSASLSDAMTKAKNVDLMGLATWTPKGSGPAEMPRVAHASYRFLVIKAGAVAPTDIAPVDIVKELG